MSNKLFPAAKLWTLLAAANDVLSHGFFIYIVLIYKYYNTNNNLSYGITKTNYFVIINRFKAIFLRRSPLLHSW